jgi:hypothetical protein
LLVDEKKEVPLGIGAQSYFYHDKELPQIKHKKQARDIEEKESFRWIEHLRATQKICPHGIVVCDREGDIFELFQEAVELKVDVIVRLTHDRALGETMFGAREGSLFEKIKATKVAGVFEVELEKEKVELELKYCTVKLAPPKRSASQKKKRAYNYLELQVVEVKGKSKEDEEIRWILLTTLKINDFEEAKLIVNRYAKRWHIELFHKALKSGYHIEDTQLEDGKKIQSLVAMLSIEAARVYALLYSARLETPASLECFLTKAEREALMLLMKLDHPMQRKEPTLKSLVEYIANEGGFQKTKRYPFPGIFTFFRGWFIVISKIQPLMILNRKKPYPSKPQATLVDPKLVGNR